MSIKINGHIYCYKKSYEKLTIIEICQQLKQPCTKLCFLRHCNNLARCGLCLIKINNKLQLGCMTKIKDGDEVITQDPEIDQAVAGKLTDLLNRHNFNCGTCARINNCEFLKLIIKYKIKLDPKNKIANIPYLVNNSSCAITFDPSKCVGCNRCAAICQYNNGKSCIHLKPVSAQHPYLVVKQVEPDVGIDQSKCLLCGQCALACCTGAIIEKSEIDKVKTALLDKNKHVVVAIAPAVRVALGELFNMKPGINVIDQICTALKQIGFDDVYDLNFFADLTIFEEGFELLNRLGIDFSNHLQKLGLTSKNKNVINHHQLPLITSCCPGWLRLANQQYPQWLDHISSTKSPQQIYGSLTKYYLKKQINNKEIYTVSIVPCTAKKYEANLANNSGHIDAVLTTRELAKMIKDQRIDFPKLKGSKFDQLFGNYSDLAPLFGTSGGVMVCAIKFLAKLLENKDLTINFTSLLGFKEIKVANVKLLGKQLKIAIINGAKNVKQFQESYDFSSFHFIEVMTCVNGCINGGGQPIILDKSDQEFNKIILARSKGLRNQKINLSTSLDNLQCRKIYQLLKMVPNDELAIKLFHNSTNKQ